MHLFVTSFLLWGNILLNACTAPLGITYTEILFITTVRLNKATF